MLMCVLLKVDGEESSLVIIYLIMCHHLLLIFSLIILTDLSNKKSKWVAATTMMLMTGKLFITSYGASRHAWQTSSHVYVAENNRDPFL